MNTSLKYALTVILSTITGILVHAADGTWTVNRSTAGEWDVQTSWSGNVIADGNGAVADFTIPQTGGTRNVYINTDRTIGILNILIGREATGSGPNFTFASNNTSTLSFNNNGLGAQINISVGSNSNSSTTTFSVPISLADSLKVTNSSGRTVLFSGPISTTAGTKTLTTDGNMTLSGGMNLGGDLTIYNSSGTLTFNSPVSAASAGTKTLSLNGTITAAGVISNGSGVTALKVINGGVITLSQTNSYSGGTLIENGGLIYATGGGTDGSATGTGAVTVDQGGVLRGIGRIAPVNNNIIINGDLRISGSDTAASRYITLANGGGNVDVIFGANAVTDLRGWSARGANQKVVFDGVNVSFDGVLKLTMSGYSFQENDSFTFFEYLNGTTVSGEFSSITGVDLASLGLAWDSSQLYTSGILTIVAIPEPATYAGLLGLGILAFILYRRRKA